MFNKINLQLFAGDDEIEEIDQEGHEGNADEEDVREGNEEKETLLKKEDTVPLSKYLEMKKQLKEYKNKSRELEQKHLDADLKLTRQQIVKKYTDKGYDQDFAETFADEIIDLKAEFRRSKQDDIAEEIDDLKADPFYEDAPAYEKELRALIGDYKKKGIEISVEDAYIKLRGKVRTKEMLEREALKKTAHKTEVENKSQPTASASKPKNPYPLDDKDRSALKRLQSEYPDAGWTEEKYFKVFSKMTR